MKKFISTCLLFILFVSVTPLFSLEETDRASIEKIIHDYTAAWNHHEGKGFADGFTDDASFVNIFGMTFSGKAEIEERHLKILQTIHRGSTLDILKTQFREVQPGLVIGLVHWKLDGFRYPGSDYNKPGDTHYGVFTQVFIITNDEWKITASQNTLIHQRTPS